MWDDKWTGKTIGAALDEAAERYGDKVATVFQNGEVTYSQLKRTADLVARGFLSLGISKGDKVAIWMAGYAEWAYVYFALARIGAIMVPVNTRYRPEEVEYVLNKSRASDSDSQGRTEQGLLESSQRTCSRRWCSRRRDTQ